MRDLLGDAMLSRRRALALGGLAVAGTVAGCASGDTSASSRVQPNSARIAAVERTRRRAGAATVDVSLHAAPADLDLGGVRVSTWAFDGQLPGKEIRAKSGDLLRVELRNDLPEATTIHWHGLALRNDMDGVPDLTQARVEPSTTFRYEFTVPDPGTYWFHPHVGTQLDRGLYAPLIVEDPDEPGDYDQEVVVVLDDWLDGTGRDPDAVLRDLLRNGMGGMGGMDHGNMPGMGGMPQSDLLGGDVGDVTYPHFLANGRVAAQPHVVRVKPNSRIRLRLINAASDTVFRVGVPGAAMIVTHTDGFPVVPQRGEVVLLGMGERIDALVQPTGGTVPLLAIPEGKDGLAQVVLRVRDGDIPDPAPLAKILLKRPVLTSTDTSATEQVGLSQRKPDVTHVLTLEGPEPKYDWTINGKVYDPAVGLPVREGQLVRLRFANKSTMFHPMHLHGHTFQVRGAADAGPRKDTVIVLPDKAVDVDFEASNPGQWLAHCHNVYHGEAGMMTVVSYME